MNILVIKQTSLGDVLHSTGHVRALKQHWPDARLTLLTATGSLDIYRHNPHVDRIITVDRYRVKHGWKKEPRWAWNHMRDVLAEVREQQFDMAFDLQGLAKSVLFLYGARADKKFVKGRWPGLKGFKDKTLHAVREMDGVLALAGVEGVNTDMEFATSSDAEQRIDALMVELGLTRDKERKSLLIMSPFSRWRSKDWPLKNFAEVARALASDWHILFTGAPDKKGEIDGALADLPGGSAQNLAGMINLEEFAELTRRADLMLTGDSFPMHVASAVDTPVVALFGPTDEQRVGPLGERSRVVRVDGCSKCDRAGCPRRCLDRLTVREVLAVLSNKQFHK